MNESPKEEPNAPEEKATVTLAGVVDKVIPAAHSSQTEKAQIIVEGADHLYREIRVDNQLIDSDGKPVALKPGAEVDVTIAADPADTKPAAKSA